MWRKQEVAGSICVQILSVNSFSLMWKTFDAFVCFVKPLQQNQHVGNTWRDPSANSSDKRCTAYEKTKTKSEFSFWLCSYRKGFKSNSKWRSTIIVFFLIVNIEKSSYPTELNLKCKISHKLSCSWMCFCATVREYIGHFTYAKKWQWVDFFFNRLQFEAWLSFRDTSNLYGSILCKQIIWHWMTVAFWG